MLDDLQVGYYDSTLEQLVSNSREMVPLDLGQNTVRVLHHIQRSTKNRVTFFKQRYNLSEGIHVEQRLAGCEIQDGQRTFILSRDSFDGQDVDSLMYNTTHFSYTVSGYIVSRWDALKWHYVQTLYQELYLLTCTAVLKQLMDQKKGLVTRRVRPRFRIFSRQVKGGALLTCLATDFYPRHINLTLFRNGQVVEEDQLSAGPVLPNANGLYQMRKTLVLTEEELLQKHNYTCVAAHLSVDNRLQVSWRAESYHSHRAHFVSPLVVVATILLLILILVLVKCRKTQDTKVHTDSLEAESVSMVTHSDSSTDQPLEDAPR
ncbi:major histocompatibility complex class I-related gene protein-like [Synchiropus splendidus]|uniref:major histocompatibility complex class I-related gene protein-like n=1 Tax=Synchiropus splendidus TaxID=270530 RepID=UPI00237E6614|nr:major histocompatibility complex class I-related gene protein-like [Synchiropus splendidus]